MISANFGGQTVGAGAITLKAGERVTLRCTAADAGVNLIKNQGAEGWDIGLGLFTITQIRWNI